MGRVYAVASGKGGVGKTTTSAALGATLAATGASVAVVDADLGMANLGPSLGVDGDGPTLHDVLAGTATVADATREGSDGLAVVPGSRDIDAFADARPEGLVEVLETLADEYEHVIVDTGAGLNTDSLAPLRAADEAVLVSTSARDALADTERTAAVCGRFGTPVRGLVLVRTDVDDAERVRERVEWEVLGTVPEDSAVPEAVEAGVALPRHAPASPAAAAYRDLARTLTGVDVPEPDRAATDPDEEEAPDIDGVTGDGSEDAENASEEPRTDEGGDAADEDEDASEEPRADEGGDAAAEDEGNAEDEEKIAPALMLDDGGGEDTDDGGGEDTDDGGKGFFSRLFG